ncbi:MAG: hypothetical protein HY362_00485 [Candidatus Aenigmarchaeota archaeon]|nr:hypothetical protein [Candidatus Aenigmarchaeota archaeon]
MFFPWSRRNKSEGVGIVPSNNSVGLNMPPIQEALTFSPRYVVSNDDCARKEGLTRAGPGIEVAREEHSIFEVGKYAPGLMITGEKKAAYRTQAGTSDAIVSSRGGYPIIRTPEGEFIHPRPNAPILAVYGTTERKLGSFAKPSRDSRLEQPACYANVFGTHGKDDVGRNAFFGASMFFPRELAGEVVPALGNPAGITDLLGLAFDREFAEHYMKGYKERVPDSGVATLEMEF